MHHPFKGSFDGPYVECVKRAAKAGFGKEPAFIREGGSIGAVVTMQKAWKVPILFLGLESAGTRLSCAERVFRLGAGLGRHEGLCALFFGTRQNGKTIGNVETSMLIRCESTGLTSHLLGSATRSVQSIARMEH